MSAVLLFAKLASALTLEQTVSGRDAGRTERTAEIEPTSLYSTQSAPDRVFDVLTKKLT